MVFTKHFTKGKGAAEVRRQRKYEDQRSKVRKMSASADKRQRSDEDYDVTHKRGSSKKMKTQPSEDALRLSAKLKDFSRTKNLENALSEYWRESNDSIRDGHHACIMVDCSARCGKISVS